MVVIEGNRKWEVRQLMEALTSLHHRPSLPAPHALSSSQILHDLAIRKGLETELFLTNNLLSVYATCGALSDAFSLFHHIPKKNVVSWTTMISGLSHHGYGEKAFDLFYSMQQDGIRPNQVTFVSLLSACCSSTFLSHGKMIHFIVVEFGWDSHVIVSTALVRMYSNCYTLDNTDNVFKNSPHKDVVSWTIIISGYVKHELCHEAMDMFVRMHVEGMMPNHYTYNIILNACANIPCIEAGKRIHACLAQTLYPNCLFIGNALLDMYAKCGNLEIACRLFIHMPKRDLVSWNAMITAFAQYDNDDEVFKHFHKMKLEGFEPDQFTYSCVLSVCSTWGDLSLGRLIHEEIKKTRLETELPVVNALLDMYAKCGCMEEAHKLFDQMETRDEASWTSMISGHVNQRTNEEAWELFNQMPKKDVLSWTAMIQGYVQHGHHESALEFFSQMQIEGICPNHITFGTVIGACAGLLDVELGQEIHAEIVWEGFQSDLNISNALIDMYSRCGSLADARSVFNGILKRDAVTWNVMIGCCADHGNGNDVFELSQQMEEDGLKPDEFTISSILSACRHAGLVCEACYYLFHALRSYHIMPSVHHYASMVDLLGRVGCLHKAAYFLNRIPFQPNLVVLMSFLSACKSHADVDLAERFADEMLNVGSENMAAHVLLYNIFAGKNKLSDEDDILQLQQLV